MPSRPPATIRAIVLTVVAIIVATVVGVHLSRKETAKLQPQVVRPAVSGPVAKPLPPSDTPAQSVAPTPAAVAATPSDKLKNFADFRARPFAVTKSSGADAWTAEDGRSPAVIRQLAHNELEVERLTKENPTIYRRQLVYRNEPIAAAVQQARATGQTVQSFSLPGLDGKEYAVEVTQNNVEPVVTAGSLAGHLVGRPSSTVCIGFKDGYESFNIISPEDSVYIVADAREPGQVMVKSIIPGKYGAAAPGNAPDYILTK